jgi:hypothetical protein
MSSIHPEGPLGLDYDPIIGVTSRGALKLLTQMSDRRALYILSYIGPPTFRAYGKTSIYG